MLPTACMALVSMTAAHVMGCCPPFCRSAAPLLASAEGRERQHQQPGLQCLLAEPSRVSSECCEESAAPGPRPNPVYGTGWCCRGHLFESYDLYSPLEVRECGMCCEPA